MVAQICGIECRVNDTTLQMVVDTGASHSILYASQVSACGLDNEIDRNVAYGIHFKTVQGVRITSLGIIHHLTMMIGALRSSHRFAILDGAGAHGLLGMDWLYANRVLIDAGNDCLRIGSDAIPIVDFRRPRM
jgi:predicted aspartyl protease